MPCSQPLLVPFPAGAEPKWDPEAPASYLQRNLVINRTESHQVHFRHVLSENTWRADSSVVRPSGMRSGTEELHREACFHAEQGG